MNLKKASPEAKSGWGGWMGWAFIYSHDGSEPSDELREALKAEARANGNMAVVLVEGYPVGYGYTDKRYKGGPYVWPLDYRK